jgi:hypothetical protein
MRGRLDPPSLSFGVASRARRLQPINRLDSWETSLDLVDKPADCKRLCNQSRYARLFALPPFNHEWTRMSTNSQSNFSTVKLISHGLPLFISIRVY